MKAGKLRHGIYVLSFTDRQTPKGDRIRTFEPTPTPFDPGAAGGVQAATYRPVDDYAAIEPLRGRELVVAMGMRADLSHRITLRYRPDVHQESRIVWVRSDGPPLVAYKFELGPEVDDELRGVEMSFYAFVIK